MRIDIDVSQAPGAARAQGSFRLADAGSTTVLEGTELGVLQTTKDWASFTARIRNRTTKAEGLVTVIVERADPFAAGNRPSVSVQVDNVLSVSGTLREPASSIESSLTQPIPDPRDLLHSISTVLTLYLSTL